MSKSVLRRWTEEEDKKLKEYMMEHKDEKGTFQALREAGELLGRSFFQVKNRWYNNLNPEKTPEILTKRKDIKTVSMSIQEIEKKAEDADLDTLFDLLLSVIIKIQENIKTIKENNAKLIKDNRELLDENNRIKEGYESLLKVINTARKMIVEEESAAPIKFKMDINGNLERIE